MSAACLSFANKEARLSVLVRGARLAHALKACYSLLKHTPRRHPKLTIGYRLAIRVLSVQKVAVLRDRFATDGRSCRPLRAAVLVAWLSRPGIPAGDSVNYTIFAAVRVGFRGRFPPRLIHS